MKSDCHIHGNLHRLWADFSAEMSQAQKQWEEINVLKEKKERKKEKTPTKTLYPGKWVNAKESSTNSN